MFKIPDDDEDDEFWKEFPLEEFGDLPASKGEKRHGSPLRKFTEEHKKPCTRNIENISENICTVDSVNCSNNLPSTSNNKWTQQNSQVSNNKLLSLGISQKTGGHPEILKSPRRLNEHRQAAMPDNTSGNHAIRPRQHTLQNDRCPRRKFPGPAGMLPRLAPGQKLTDEVIKLDEKGNKSHLQKTETLLPSNPIEDFFSESPWLKLVADLGEDSSKILKTFSIKDLHTKANKKQLHQGKVLLLFTVLETVDLSSLDASVRLRDKTGSIQGTIHRNLVKEYGEHLQPGTVLVLKQVGVLSPTPRTHYLNITTNNLVSLYSILPSGCVGTHWQEKNMTYRKLLTNTEMLQRHRNLALHAQQPATTLVQSPPVKIISAVSRRPLSVQTSPLQNIGTKNSPWSFQTNVCDKIPRFPSKNPVASFETQNPHSTIQGRHLDSNQGSSSFTNKELSQVNPTTPEASRSRWTFKSNVSVSKQISGPSLSLSSSSCLSCPLAPNPGALNSLNSQASFENENSKSRSSVSAGCSSNDINCDFMAGDRYRLRPDNSTVKITSTTVIETDTNVSDVWQDELPDDILSQLSDDLF